MVIIRLLPCDVDLYVIELMRKNKLPINPLNILFLCVQLHFIPIKPKNENQRIHFQDLYEELVNDGERNQLICADVIQAVQNGRSPADINRKK